MNSLIRMYIDSLTIDKVKTFASEHKIELSDEEFNTVYTVIKQKGDLLVKDESALTSELKNSVNQEAFDKIEILISKYKEKYKMFL